MSLTSMSSTPGACAPSTSTREPCALAMAVSALTGLIMDGCVQMKQRRTVMQSQTPKTSQERTYHGADVRTDAHSCTTNARECALQCISQPTLATQGILNGNG